MWLTVSPQKISSDPTIPQGKYMNFSWDGYDTYSADTIGTTDSNYTFLIPRSYAVQTNSSGMLTFGGDFT